MTATAADPLCEATGWPIRVGLVNNMPDAAFLDTEAQFRQALQAGAGAGLPVALDLYTITEIPRSERTRAIIRARYQGLDELWASPPDALIVTGTEPRCSALALEPCWPHLEQLLDWASCAVPTVLLSCLAAHAGLLVFDGIDRVQRPVKCTGVFRGRVGDEGEPLAQGLGEAVPIPHSRINEVSEAEILEAGYRVVVGSGPAGEGWSVAARECRDALVVLCQGHPEYSRLSLLREYRRDVRRHLFGSGAPAYPALPAGYLSEQAAETLAAFQARATRPGADPHALWAAFPYDEVAAGVQNTWVDGTVTLYANWLRAARVASAATL